MGRILGNRNIVRIHYTIDMDDWLGILGVDDIDMRWQGVNEMSTYQWHCSRPETVNEAWHIAYPDGKVWRTIRRNGDGLWHDDRYGTRYVSREDAKAQAQDDFEWQQRVNHEATISSEEYARRAKPYVDALSAWLQLPWYKRIFTKLPQRKDYDL